METEVFEKEHTAGLEVLSLFGSLGTIFSKFNFGVEVFTYSIFNLAERHFGVDFAFGLTHVAHDDEASAVSKDFFESGESTTDAGIVGDFTVFVQGYIEIHTDDGLFAVEIVLIDSH